jgi:hypothetical protein
VASDPAVILIECAPPGCECCHLVTSYTCDWACWTLTHVRRGGGQTQSLGAVAWQSSGCRHWWRDVGDWAGNEEEREDERERAVKGEPTPGGFYLAVYRQPQAVGPVVQHQLRHLRRRFVCKGQQWPKKPFPRSALDAKNSTSWVAAFSRASRIEHGKSDRICLDRIHQGADAWANKRSKHARRSSRLEGGFEMDCAELCRGARFLVSPSREMDDGGTLACGRGRNVQCMPATHLDLAEVPLFDNHRRQVGPDRPRGQTISHCRQEQENALQRRVGRGSVGRSRTSFRKLFAAVGPRSPRKIQGAGATNRWSNYGKPVTVWL